MAPHRTQSRRIRPTRLYITDEIERELTAFHEAGHALAALVLDSAIDYVAVSGAETGSTGRLAAGRKFLRDLANAKGNKREEQKAHQRALIADIICSASGPVAQQLHLLIKYGAMPPGARTSKFELRWGGEDDEAAIAAAIGRRPTRAQLDEFCKLATWFLIGTKHRAAQLVALATRLNREGHLTARQVQHCISRVRVPKRPAGDLKLYFAFLKHGLRASPRGVAGTGGLRTRGAA